MAKAARQVDTEDWLENLLAVMADVSDFLSTYQDTIDSALDTPTADLKQRVDDVLNPDKQTSM